MNSLHDSPSWILSFLFLIPFLVVSSTQAFAADKNNLVGKYGASVTAQNYTGKFPGENSTQTP
jgi:hypothetical protein